MTAVLGSLGQSLFAAIAFCGAGYLFNMFDKDGYNEDMKRHDKAEEALEKAQEKFTENEIKKKDEIVRKRQELSDANADINTTNKALNLLYHIEHQGKTFNYTNMPKLCKYFGKIFTFGSC